MNQSPPRKYPSASSDAERRRERAWGVVLANQLALPGFGTVMAGRRIGYAQLGLSIAGVICFTAFLIYAVPRLGDLLQQLFHPSEDPDVALEMLAQWLPWLGVALVGIVLWVFAWLWAFATSVRALKSSVKK